MGDDGVVGGPPPSQSAHSKARRALLVRTRVWLASALWFPVVLANLVAIALGITLPFVDDRLGDQPSLPITLSTVEETFGALAAGMITFTGIVFSAVLVAAQLETSSYSPRLAAMLRRDPVVTAALAFPTATASYALFALAAIGREADSSGENVASALTVAVALLLTIVTFAAFIALVQRALDRIQIGGIFRTIVRLTYRVIDDVHPLGTPVADAPTPEAAAQSVVDIRHTGRPGILASIDRAALVALARNCDAFVEVAPMVGYYISPGAVTLRLRGARRTPDARLTQRVLVLARQRTIDQDPAFGLRMLVDIAIRGLSPAVNDPTTAVQALDRIETLLLEIHGRRPGPAVVADENGTPRGLVPAPRWEQYIDLGLTEIRRYGAGSIQVARRLRAMYDHLLEVVGEAGRERIELERRLLDEELAVSFPDRDERGIASRPDRLGLGSAA
jgi:uncharacterized membrane protein